MLLHSIWNTWLVRAFQGRHFPAVELLLFRYQLRMANASASGPRMVKTRRKLYANTWRLISVATRLRVFIWKCVWPIQDLMVPKGCSTVGPQILIRSGLLAMRLSSSSSTWSCSHLVTRRFCLVVQRSFILQVEQAEDKYLSNVISRSIVWKRNTRRSPAGQTYSSSS